jgi:hypothetical protein
MLSCESKNGGFYELPGDHTYGETPDPIPNSEAKPVRPMVALRGESRYRQDLYPDRRENAYRDSFFWASPAPFCEVAARILIMGAVKERLCETFPSHNA